MKELGTGKGNAALPRWAVVLVHVLFFFSGAAGLVYEVVWMRMLSFVFGNTTYAVSVVLATFLGGLAIGAWAYGRVADRRSDLLKVYGMLEVAAAAIALAMPFLLLGVLTPVYTWVYQRAGESAVALTVARLVLSGVVLVVPAVLLGGTLPVLVRFLVRRDSGMEAYIGRLYGLNTLGAVAGSFAAGFVLLPFLGMRWSNTVGAALGLCVAAAALAAHRWLGARAQVDGAWAPRDVSGQEETPPVGERRWLLFAFALSGFAALAYEVLWTRLLVFFFKGSVYSFSAMLCVYLFGLALGSLIYSLWISKSRRQVRWFILLEVLIGATGACSLAAFLLLPRLTFLHFRVGFWNEALWVFTAAAVVMLIPTVLIGAVFPMVSGMWARAKGRVGSGVGDVYLVNTVGTVAGAMVTGFILIPTIGTPAALFLAAGLNVFAGLVVWSATGGLRGRVLRAGAAVGVPLALVLGLSGVVTGADMVRTIRGNDRVDIEWVREGIDGTVTIERVHPVQKALAGPGEPRVLAVNGINVAGTLFDLQTTQRLQAHLAMLIHPRPRTVMHIGFGSGGTAYSVTQHPVERLDAVEISDAVIKAAPYLPETNRGVLTEPRVHVHLEDARTYVKHTPRRYDLILSDLAHPTHAGQGFFYSVDYLSDCKERLAPGGFFSTWVPLHGLSLYDLKVVVRSIKSVFPYVYIWHSAGGRNEFCVIHGMNEPLEIDYQSFARRMEVPGVAADLDWIGLRKPEEVLALLLYDDEAVARWVGSGGVVNTDDNGYLEFRAAWRLREVPAARRVHFLAVYPDLVSNAGGSATEYVEGALALSPAWREEMRKQEEANRHVLWGRLYELAREDRYMLLAALQYRQALEIVPDHFVAQSLLGITERQMAEASGEADAPEARLGALEKWQGYLIAANRLGEAAGWIDEHGQGEEWGPPAEAIVGVLREIPGEVRGALEQSRGGRRERWTAPMDRAAVVAALDRQEAAQRDPDDAAVWLALGDSYAELAAQISGRAFRPAASTQGELIGVLHNIGIQATASLLTLAEKSYGKAVALSDGSATARYRQAAVRTATGDHAGAAELMEGIAGEPIARSGKLVPVETVREQAAALREHERDRFGFLRELREHIVGSTGAAHHARPSRVSG